MGPPKAVRPSLSATQSTSRAYPVGARVAVASWLKAGTVKRISARWVATMDHI